MWTLFLTTWWKHWQSKPIKTFASCPNSQIKVVGKHFLYWVPPKRCDLNSTSYYYKQIIASFKAKTLTLQKLVSLELMCGCSLMAGEHKGVEKYF